MALRIRRGTDAERQTIVPAQGEPVYVTDTKKLFVGDGATQGGVLVGPQDQSNFDLVNDTTPQLGGGLDLNGNDITGTGNINIDGTITASGTVNLGDNSGGDQLNVGALITSSLRPATANAYDLGTPNRPWANAYVRDIVADETISANNITVKESIVSENSTVIYNGTTDTINVTGITAATIDGDLTGSVFMDDSTTVLVDAVNGSFETPEQLKIFSQDITVSNGTFPLRINATELTLNYSGVEGDVFSSALTVMNATRGTVAAPTNVQVGDFIGAFVTTGLTAGSADPKIGLATQIDTVTGTATLPAKFVLLGENFDGTIVPQFEVNSRGVASATGAFQNPVYADDAARDAAIPTPAAGMTVFNTTNTKLQVYTGSAWVDCN
ncbi:hypothetical protein N9D49_00945 [bacterium]|nr:hypothetical protein [bacterium]